MQTSGSSADKTGLSSPLLKEQISLLYRDSTTYYQLGMGCALVCCTLLWSDQSNPLLLIWSIFYGLLTFGGIQLNQRFMRRDAASSDLTHWKKLFTLGGLLTGSCWGILITFLTPAESLFHQSAVAICMTGLALYASAIFSALLVTWLAFVLPAFVPFILIEFQTDTPLISPYILCIFLAFLLYSAWRNHLFLKDSLSAKVRNDQLLEEMAEEQARTEELNHQLAREVSTRTKAEKQLQQAHHHLEQQVEDRTRDLSISNQQLQDAIEQQKQASEALDKNRQRYSKAIEASDLGLWEWDLDSDHIFHSHFEQLFGYSEHEVPHFMGHLKPLVHQEDYPALRRALVDNLKGVTDQFRVQFRIRHKSGQWRWLEDTGRVMERQSDTGHARLMMGTRRDITDQVRTDEKLSLAWQAFESSSEAIFILDEDFIITTINQAFSQITGYAAAELRGLSITNCPLWQEDTELTTRIRRQLMELGSWEGELVEQRKSGDRFPEWLKIDRVPARQGGHSHYVGMFSDLTQRKKAEEKLSYMANYDDLTGVANRNLFKDRLHVAISHARLNRTKVALLLLDIDRFKAINNTLGHDVGDQLLQELANRLTSHIQDVDTIARLGADEFALILDDYHSLHDVNQLAQQVADLVHTPFMIDEHELIVSSSIGISLFPKHTRGLNILVNQADLARNKVKQQGGSGFEFYSEELQTGSVERLKLENDLRKALQRDELCVYYQPKTCLKENRIYEAEALVRWSHPESGLISPGSFIPIAEETGLISAIGEQVFIKSCQQIRNWLNKGMQIKVSVNLAAQQLVQSDLISFIQQTMKEYDVPPELIELELTESSLIEDPERTVAVLEQIRALGITLAIDDFGTGYSSLSYLQRFPLDILKVDRSFLKHINSPDPQQATLTKAIIALGHNLDMKIVAEGVETRAQLEFLKRQRCDYAQGFYISPPVPAQTFYELVENYNNQPAPLT